MCNAKEMTFHVASNFIYATTHPTEILMQVSISCKFECCSAAKTLTFSSGLTAVCAYIWSFIFKHLLYTPNSISIPWPKIKHEYEQLKPRLAFPNAIHVSKVKNLKRTIDKSKKIISPFVIFKKKLTIDRFSLGIYALGPQVLTYRPQILQGVRIRTFQSTISKIMNLITFKLKKRN